MYAIPAATLCHIAADVFHPWLYGSRTRHRRGTSADSSQHSENPKERAAARAHGWETLPFDILRDLICATTFYRKTTPRFGANVCDRLRHPSAGYQPYLRALLRYPRIRKFPGHRPRCPNLGRDGAAPSVHHPGEWLAASVSRLMPRHLPLQRPRPLRPPCHRLRPPGPPWRHSLNGTLKRICGGHLRCESCPQLWGTTRTMARTSF